ncbi:MAG: two-component system, OmpR family, sensor histidine kinase KdpD [Euryarchaeota archaeon]|nr:two-component system, OmpR family, sensor histidine kinase KdpD [Euryarchaeota archaeon]
MTAYTIIHQYYSQEPISILFIPLKKQIPLFFAAEYVFSLILVVAVVGVNFLLKEYIGLTNLLIFQLVPVLVSAFFFRRSVSFFTAVMSVLIFDFLFVKPYYTFTVTDWEYFIAFIGYVIIALIVSSLTTRLRYLVPQISHSEAEVGATSGLSRELVKAKTRKDAFRTLANQMHNFGSGTFAILSYDHMGVHIEAGDSDFPLDENERIIVIWVYNNSQIAGYGTSNLPEGRGYYIPIKIHKKIFGLMAFVFEKPEEVLTPENRKLFETMAFLGALTLERL